MIAAQRSFWHLLFGLGTAGVIGFIGLLGTGRAAPEYGTTLAAAAVAVLSLMVHGAFLIWDPNRKPQANLEKARRFRRLGRLERLRGETPELAKEELPHPRFRWLHAAALIGMAVGVVPFVTPEVVRLVRGWPLNRGWFPAVVGPGDEARIYHPSSVQSLTGLWTGEATAEALNARELGLARAQLEATTHQDSWGNFIQFEQKHKTGYVRPWVDVRVPDAAQLAGKDLQVKVDVMVTYPADHGANFLNEQRLFTQTAFIQLADTPGAGSVYTALCRGGTFGGALWLLLMGLVLALAARPFRYDGFPGKPAAEREDDDDDDYDDRPRRSRSRRIRDDDDRPPRGRSRRIRGDDD
jgi:hypothetical protein